MAIQYAGGVIQNSTLVQSAGTRAELAQWIRDQLVAAGWTSAGSATDYQLTTAITPQSLQGRVRVYDPGSGSCARLKFSNVAGTKIQVGDLFLLPAVSKAWRIIADKYQFFVMTAGAPLGRDFACGGVPYLPSFLSGVITECIWCASTANGDGDTSNQPSLRTKLYVKTFSNYFCLCNGTIHESNSGSSDNIGTPRLLATATSRLDQGVATSYRWHDDSQFITDPLIGWGLTTPSDETKLRGQLWDGAMLSDAWAADVTLQLDAGNPTYNFMTITNNNVGSSGEARGTLCIRTS